MKILIVSTSILPEDGGAEKVAWDTAKTLAHSNEVHVLSTTRPPEKNAEVTVHTIPHVPFPTLYYATIGWPIIKKIIRKHRFDVVHAHMSLPWGFVLRNIKAKKVITLHGCEYQAKNVLYRLLAKAAYAKADIIISPSRWLKEYVKKNYGFVARVIPNGIDTSRYGANSIRQRKNIILFVGRLIPQKGVRELLAVARSLPHLEFWFVGKGPLRTAITLPNTRYLGYFNDERTVIQFYKQATICVFPSYEENFPTVGLEALACGKAVVATKSGFSEMFEHGKSALLIKPQNVQQLQDAIQTLMNDQNMRQQFEKNALKKSVQFDIGTSVKTHDLLYKQLVGT